MDDTAPVRGGERIGDLDAVTQSFFQRKRSFGGPALHVFHDEVVVADVVERADMWMIEGGDGTGLALEAPGKSVLQELDRDGAIETCVARGPDLTHAACRDGSD